MNNALHPTALQRFAAWLRALYLASLCCFVLQAIGAAWRDSWCCAQLSRILGKPAACASSRAHALLAHLSARMERHSDRLAGKIHESIFYHICQAILRAGRESRLLGWLFAGGAGGLLLFAIGGYVIWDYLLRDVFSIPVLSSFWDEALLLLCLIYLLYQRKTAQLRLPVYDTPLDLPVVFFLVICTGLLLLDLSVPAINISGYRATVQYILWFFVVTRLLRDDRDCKQLYLTMVAIASVIGLHGIYQYIVGAPIPANWVDQSEASVRTRVYSIFSSCNIMGDFMVLFAPMAAGLAYACRDLRLKLLAWGCTLVMCLSCLLTMSRGAWIALVVAILIFAVLVDLRLLAVMAAGGCLAMFLPFVQSRIGYLFTDAFAASTNRGGRAVRWQKAIGYLYDANPVLGMGFGRFGGAIAMQNKASPVLEYFYTDNYYVKILSENGFVGLISFVFMMLGVLWTGLRSWFRTRQSKSRMAPMCAGMLSGMAGVLVHCYFENIFEEPYMMAIFWTIAAMTVYLGFLRPTRQDA